MLIRTKAAGSLVLTDRTNNAAPAVITRTNKQYCMCVKKCNVMHNASNCGYENKNGNYEDKQTEPAVITKQIHSNMFHMHFMHGPTDTT